jgi:hypothetical protein
MLRSTVGLVIPIICFGVYSGFFFQGWIRLQTNKFNYYRELAVSLNDGRLDVACPPRTGCHDLAEKDGKYYIYYGPVPALAFVPLVAIFRENTPDSLIAALIGCLNVFLFLSVYRGMRSFAPSDATGRALLRGNLRAQAGQEQLVYGILWGLGTVHCYMTMHGDVWHLSQVMGQTFLLLSLRALFAEHRAWLMIAAVFFSLAAFTRYTLIFGGLFFPWIIWLRRPSWREFLKHCAVFGGIFTGATALFLYYNYARFGNPFEPGLSFMKLESVSGVAARVAQVGTFSMQNFFPNFYHEILKAPEFSRAFPFIQLDSHGFGVLWGTPFYLLLFPAIRNLYTRYRTGYQVTAHTLISVACLIAAAAMAFFILTLSAHGFMQYSARYSLDFQVFMILFLALKPGYFRPRTLWMFLALSVYMNISGAWLFMKFFTKGIS